MKTHRTVPDSYSGHKKKTSYSKQHVSRAAAKDTPNIADDIIVGRHPVLEALRAGRSFQRVWINNTSVTDGSVREIVGLSREKKIVVHEVPRAKLDELAGGLNHQGVVAMVSSIPVASLDDVHKLVVKREFDVLLIMLDQIQDPQNLGAIIRVAGAVGADAVIMPARNTAPISTAVRKASAGATEYVPVAIVPNLAQAIETVKKWGIFVYGADPEGEVLYTQQDFRGPTALVIGSEGKGVRPLVRSRCDQTVRLPMTGQVASLNAATACAVLAFEVLRQRQMS
ncbi:MAG: 23S rRNA (guanosine(2251)-2'-O)-methyltransferase RlmB [Firmicutes bacterium]|nr:23S rRNA (guanosine(2251)-2'-O)-methyltransferase RlmB [Bacillota bacterium]MCL5014627.1 23S rRNA (guanosine(2251)-2'-O)-methyltransferase RlmB [Bacillota bacterium]